MSAREIPGRRNPPGMCPEILGSIRFALADDSDVEGNPGSEKASVRRAVENRFIGLYVPRIGENVKAGNHESAGKDIDGMVAGVGGSAGGR